MLTPLVPLNANVFHVDPYIFDAVQFQVFGPSHDTPRIAYPPPVCALVLLVHQVGVTTFQTTSGVGYPSEEQLMLVPTTKLVLSVAFMEMKLGAVKKSIVTFFCKLLNFDNILMIFYT